LGVALAAVIPSLVSGCGKSVPLGDVDGTVRLDGQPVGQVLVVFVPDDPHLPQSIGITDEQGHFHLRCNNQKMGAAIGEHHVTLVDATTSPASKSRNDDEPREGTDAPVRRIPANYARASSTPLRESVAAGSQTIEIEVPSGKKPT
jgi:hypothetical protein